MKLPLSLLLLASIITVDADPLATGFATPPRDSHPETWFHLIGGNVAKAGLTADLEAIHEAGLRGIQLFHGSGRTTFPAVTHPIQCLSAEWDQMIGHAADESARLGLKFSMQNCPGWSQSGGPWIKPENAMRHLISSRVEVAGGQPLSLSLPIPQPSTENWRNYQDIAVIAFPTPADAEIPDLIPTGFKSNHPTIPWAKLFAPGNKASCKIPPAKEPAWVEFSFDRPVTLRSFDLPPTGIFTIRKIFDPRVSIRIHAVGESGLTEIAHRPIPRGNWQDKYELLTVAVPDATARAFRFTFENKTPLELTSLRLSSAARINDWQGQAGYVLRSLDRSPAPKQNPGAWIDSNTIIDITSSMDADGTLNWQAPPGKWTVLRFGHVNTGKKNGPAPPEATGFECDKLATLGADLHFAGYIGRISAPGGPADNGRLKGMTIDSWECHTQTWTPLMEQEFTTRHLYSLRKWLPALAGWVIDDHGTSERFLRDWRATISDLIAHSYYGRLAELARERGMELYFETGPGDVAIGDILEYFSRADVPMCEFWQANDPHWGGLETKPILPAVSAAHIYGKPRVAAEAFTNVGIQWDEHPGMLKHLADRHFAMGLNHLVFHTYTHNPSIATVPGTSFGGRIGTPFIRGQTWWKHMPEFTAYLARTSFALQQGRPVADVLWYLGDDIDHKPRQDSPFPDGYKFDYLNSDALTKRITVTPDGLFTTPEGLTWKLLWLPNTPRLTAATLTRLRDLVNQGGTVVGLPSPINPGLSDDKSHAALISELWANHPAGDRKLGKGRLIWGTSLDKTLDTLAIPPDVTGSTTAQWCHRQADGTDIYFIAADRVTPLKANLSFRSHGIPELWDPLTGTTTPIHISHRSGAHTIIPMDLPAAGSAFVIFRPGKGEPSFTGIQHNGKTLTNVTDATLTEKGIPYPIQGLTQKDELQPWIEPAPPSYDLISKGTQLVAWMPGDYSLTRPDQSVLKVKATKAKGIPLTNKWILNFPSGWDTPEKIELPTLQAWSELPDPATRAFSGTATYTTTADLDTPSADTRLMLDLGRVADIAEIEVNGKSVAKLWVPPFRADITPYVRAGKNDIAIKVTNTWHNRLTHEASLPKAQQKTWTLHAPEADSPLKPAGLPGPVTLRQGEVVDLTR